MANGYISQEEYAKTKLYPAVASGIGFLVLRLIINASDGFFGFVFKLILVPTSILLAIFTIVYLYKYIQIKRIPANEWDEYVKNERILLSLAVYVHPVTGDTRTVRRGFSLPVFLFGVFVPLFRGQFSLAIKFLVVVVGLNIVGSIIPVIGNFVAWFLSHWGIARKYNKYYEDWLKEEGYVLQDAHGIMDDWSKISQTSKTIFSSNNMEEVSSNMKLLQESDNGKFDNVPQSTNGLLELNDKVTPSHSAIILPESLSPAKNSNENQVTETDTEKEEKIVSLKETENVEKENIISTPKKSVTKKILLSAAVVVIVIMGIIGGKFVIDKVELQKIEAYLRELEAKKESRLNEIKSKEGIHLITVKDGIAYYWEDDKISYWKTNLETGQTEERKIEAEDLSYINEAYYTDKQNCIIIICNTGSFYKQELNRVYKYDLSTNKFEEILSGEKIKHSVDYFLVTKREYIVKGEVAVEDIFFWFEECYDYNGKLIDGKTVRGRGYIGGQYPIEMSFHSLNGKVTGWYKYKGHTNYMEIKGTIQSDHSFIFTEYNEDGEAFGTFTGTVDFDNEQINGTFTNEKQGQVFAFWVDELACGAQDKLNDWNDLHTYDGTLALESLYAPTVSFYGQDLPGSKCAELVKSTIDKYITYSQTLGTKVAYNRVDRNTIRLDFTKSVTTNGSSKEYEAYLVFQRMADGNLVIIKESDKQTDAYFERNKKRNG